MSHALSILREKIANFSDGEIDLATLWEQLDKEFATENGECETKENHVLVGCT